MHGLHTERVRYFYDGFEAWLRSRRQGFVKTFTSETCVFRHLRHAFRSGRIAECNKQQVRIVGFQYGCHVFGYRFIAWQQIARGLFSFLIEPYAC